MKNNLPIIVAVVLGVMAVLAVSRVVRDQRPAETASVNVVGVTRNIETGAVLGPDSVLEKSVPLAAKPAEAIPWSQRSMLYGQTVTRLIQAGDYVLISDVSFRRSIVGEGEWAVTIAVNPTGIASRLQPGDEVAVIATFPALVEEEFAVIDDMLPEITQDEVTVVLFPKVRVLDAMTAQEMAPGLVGEPDSITVSLPPRQAQLLIAARRRAELSLALRRSGDINWVGGVEVGAPIPGRPRYRLRYRCAQQCLCGWPAGSTLAAWPGTRSRSPAVISVAVVAVRRSSIPSSRAHLRVGRRRLSTTSAARHLWIRETAGSNSLSRGCWWSPISNIQQGISNDQGKRIRPVGGVEYPISNKEYPMTKAREYGLLVESNIQYPTRNIQ